MLYTMGQAELATTLFPAGDLPKSRIRELAREMRLELADKPDSADICFVPDGDYKQFVRNRLPARAGVIRDRDGAIVGEHDGVAGFTVGQRKGLGVALGEKRFVTTIDAESNVVTIGAEEDLMSPALVAENVNWIEGAPPPNAVYATVKIRYRTPAASATVTPLDDRCARVEFDDPQRAVTPGQAAVFYRGDEVIGGGAIREAAKSK